VGREEGMESSDEDGRPHTRARGVFVERLYNSRDRARDLHAVIYDAHKSAGRRHDI
jgi:hypothetical protein